VTFQLGPGYYGPAPDDWPESVAGPHPVGAEPWQPVDYADTWPPLDLDAAHPDHARALAAGGPGPDEPGTWTDPADTEQRWGFGGMAEPTCRHGVTGPCVACETECVHGNYGPGCPTCREVYG
jgi:hypothetical protein